MNLATPVSQRIAVLRFVMIFGVVVLHTPQYVPIAELGSGNFDLFKAFFQSALFRASVPMLTVISGYLLFGSGLDRHPVKLYRKKFRSLVVPFFCFNVMLVLSAYVLQRQTTIALPGGLGHASVLQWFDAALGLTGMPFNYPLNFLRDLIMLMVLAPALGLMIRCMPLVGLAATAMFFLDDFDGFLVTRNAMPVLFYLGGLAAVYRWDVLALDRYALPCLALLLAACAGVLAWRITNTTPLAMLSPFLLWPAASLLMRLRGIGLVAHMSRYSLFIFVAHAPLLALSWILFQRYRHDLPYECYWVLTPFVVVTLLVGCYRLAARWMPHTFALMLGVRVRAAGQGAEAYQA